MINHEKLLLYSLLPYFLSKLSLVYASVRGEIDGCLYFL
jgi:hypothetical protein